MMLLLVVLPLAVLSQQPLYGPSQLDQYARLINSGNLGGFGWFNDAVNKGVVRNIGDVGGQSRLRGLPPLPLTHDEVLHQLTSTPKPSTTPATARPTTAATMAPPMPIYAVNSAPEMPPRPEDRIRGKFDDDGIFHPDEEEAKLKRNQIYGAKIKELPDKADQPQEANEDENDDFYDEVGLRGAKSRRVTRQHQIDQSVQRSSARRVSHDIHPRQIRPNQLPPQPRVVQQLPPAPRPPVQQLPPQPQYPGFVFQPRPSPTGREQVLTNLLTEIEEYDDFLEQHRVYREQYPYAKPVLNPYRLLPEGQLPTLPRPIQYQQQQSPVYTPQQAPPVPQAQPQAWAVNGASSHPTQPSTTAENPLLSIFNLFRVPQAHAAPTVSGEGANNIPLVDINQRPLQLVNPLAGIFSSRR